MTDLRKPIERRLSTFQDRGRDVVVRITAEGVYLKQTGQRWTSAVLCPWAAAFSVACKIAADHERRARGARRSWGDYSRPRA